MKLRLFVAAVFCCAALASVPALRASADTAYLTIVRAGSNTVGTDATKSVSLGVEYELDNFSMTQQVSPTGGTGGQTGTTTAASFSATTALTGSSAALLSLSSLVPEITVRLAAGNSASNSKALSAETSVKLESADKPSPNADTFRFKSCLMSSSNLTSSSATLTFTCGAVAMTTPGGDGSPLLKGSGANPGGIAPITKSSGLDTYVEYNGAIAHITSFAADQQTAQNIGATARAGSAPTGTLAFTLPLDGSGKMLSDLVGRGSQGAPLKVTFVKGGDPISKPLLVETYAPWTVETLATSFGDAKAVTDVLIRYGNAKVVVSGSSSPGAPPTATSPGWNRVKNTQSTTTQTLTTSKP